MKQAKATNIVKNVPGLNDEEVRTRRAQFGANIINGGKQNRLWLLIRGIIAEPLFVLLSCTAILYFVLGDYHQGAVMLVAISFVSGIGVYQEIKSRTALESLKKLSAPYATVIRNGEVVKI